MAWASITYPEHPSTLVAAVSTYYEQESYMDVSFMCAGLERVEAHRLVLTSVSPFMKTLLMEHCGPEPPVISLPDVSQHLLRLVLQFLYDGVMKVNQDELAEFKNILTVLGIKVPNATVVKLNERIPTKLNPSSKDLFVRRPPKRPSPVAQSRSPALVAVPPPTPSKVTDVDPSDDPLNVPDFYFRPQPSQPETTDATVSSAAASTATPVIEPDPMPMDDEEEEAAALEIPVSRSSVTLQTSSPTVPTVNTSRRSTRSSIKPATPQQQPPPSPEVLIKVEREDEDMNQSNSSLVNTSFLLTTLKKEVLDCMETEHARPDSKQRPEGMWNALYSNENDKLLWKPSSDTHSYDTETESSMFNDLQIKIENIRSLEEGLMEFSPLTPQSSTDPEAITPTRTWHSKKRPTCLVKEAMLDITRGKVPINTNTISNPMLTFTDEQIDILNEEFKANTFPTAIYIQQLSADLELPSSRIDDWFRHKRSEMSVTTNNKRYKTDLSQEQLDRLLEEFESNSTPVFENYAQLGQELGLSEVKVYQWFTAQRHKLRKKTNSNEPAPSRPSMFQIKHYLTPEQVKRLNVEFLQNPMLTADQCCVLADKLGISQVKVYRWFKSRLHKLKKQSHAKGSILHVKAEKTKNRLKSSDLLDTLKHKNPKGHVRAEKIETSLISSTHLSNFKHESPKEAAKKCFLNPDQLSYLKEEFVENHYPNKEHREFLAQELSLNEKKISNWFNKVRQKMMSANLNLNSRSERKSIIRHVTTGYGPIRRVLHKTELVCDTTSRPNTRVERGVVRRFLSPNQLSSLKKNFVESPVLLKQERELLARELGLKEKKVANWFKKVRTKMRQANLNCNDQAARRSIVGYITTGQGPKKYLHHQTVATGGPDIKTEDIADTEITC